MAKIINVAGVGQLAFPDDMKDDEIKVILDRDFGPNSKNPPTFFDQLKNSPIGGFVRGLRDIPDAGAQLITEGLDAITPDNTSIGQWAKGEKERIAAINRQAELDYQHNWRRGQMGDSIDVGRIGGNIVGTAPVAAAAAPIRAGMTGMQMIGRGAVQGAIGGALQPVQNAEDAGFWEQKGMQTAVGAGLGAGGTAAGNALGTAIQGARRANAAAAAARAGGGKGSASASVTVNPTVKGYGGGSVLGQVGEDPTSALTSSQKRILERGKELGLRATPGQASGSRALQQMEARMESSPLFSGPFNTLKVNNQEALNRAVAGGIGETADVVDSAVLAQAEERLGSIFERVADKVPKAVIGDDIVGRLAAIEQDVAGVIDKPFADNALVKRAVNIAANGQATGAELRSLSSKLGRAAKGQMRNDPEFGIALFKVKDMVDDIVASNLDDATRAAFDEARGQYRNLMTILSRQNTVNPASGNVSGANLASALMSRDKSGYTMGRNTSDMYDAARFAQAFKPLVNDSGTATRSMQMGPMDWMISLPTRLATSAYLSQPAVSAATKLGGGVAPNPYGDTLANFLRQRGGLLTQGGGFGMIEGGQ